MYYNTCSKCGSNNDPGEHCECEKAFNYEQQAKSTMDNFNKKINILIRSGETREQKNDYKREG